MAKVGLPKTDSLEIIVVEFQIQTYDQIQIIERKYYASETAAAKSLFNYFTEEKYMRHEYKEVHHYDSYLLCPECSFGPHSILVEKSIVDYIPTPYTIEDCFDIVKTKNRTKIGGDAFVGHEYVYVSRAHLISS